MESNVPSSQLEEKAVTAVETFLHTDLPCSIVEVLNNTGKTLLVTQYANEDSPGKTYIQPDKSYYRVSGIVNANQVSVSNGTDGSSVTVQYRYSD